MKIWGAVFEIVSNASDVSTLLQSAVAACELTFLLVMLAYFRVVDGPPPRAAIVKGTAADLDDVTETSPLLNDTRSIQ